MTAPLRLAHVTHWPLPSNDTATIQLVQTLSALAELGVAAELWFPRPPWRRARPAEQLRSQLAAHYGVPCRFLPREVGSLLRSEAASRLLLALLSIPRTGGSRFDVVHTRDLEVACACALAGRPVLFESFRLWTRRSALHRRLLLRLTGRPRCLGLVTHSRYTADRYLADGVPAEKLRVIYNGFDPAPFAEPRTPREARAALGLRESPTAVFLGTIALDKRVDLLLEAAARTPAIRWVLGGDERRPEAAPLIARASGLPNVEFAGYVTGARLGLLLQAGDVLVIPPSRDPLERSGHTILPIKLFQYLAAGRAIVTGEVPDTAELLQHDRNAVRILPDDPAVLAQAVADLIAEPGRRERLAAAALRDAARYTWQARAGNFLAFVQERLGGPDERASGR